MLYSSIPGGLEVGVGFLRNVATVILILLNNSGSSMIPLTILLFS